MKMLLGLLVAIMALAAMVLPWLGCATTTKGCSPPAQQMRQCDPSDYPPLTDTLPKSPIPKPMTPGVLR